MAVDFKRTKELFELNGRVFSVMGVWPLQSTYVRFSLWIVYLLIHMGALFADFFHVFRNLDLMILNLSESTWNIMIILKLMVMRFSRTLAKLTKRIIDEADTEFFKNSKEKKIYLKYNRIATLFFKLWVTMGIVTAFVYHLKPLEFRLKAGLPNESSPFVLPYHTRYFFEVNDSMTFWLVWLYQCPVICISMSQTASIGYLFSLILYVCGQLSVLAFRIKNLDLDSRDEHNKPIDTIFRDIVQRHRNILEMARDINDVFGLLLLEELLISTVLIGLTSYCVLANVGLENTGLFLAFFLYGLTLLFLIYGYCVAGEYLITESENLYEAYYQCQWYDMSESFKKQLIICMTRARTPIQLTGGGFCTFSLVSFTSVLKTAGGYISMLRTII